MSKTFFVQEVLRLGLAVWCIDNGGDSSTQCQTPAMAVHHLPDSFVENIKFNGAFYG